MERPSVGGERQRDARPTRWRELAQPNVHYASVAARRPETMVPLRARRFLSRIGAVTARCRAAVLERLGMDVEARLSMMPWRRQRPSPERLLRPRMRCRAGPAIPRDASHKSSLTLERDARSYRRLLFLCSIETR